WFDYHMDKIVSVVRNMRVRLSVRKTKGIPLRSNALCPLILGILGFPMHCRPAEVDISKLPPPAARTVDFVKDIQPMLTERCYSCHGPKKQKSDLRWDTKESVFKGGEHGPVLVPGKSAASRVIHLVAGLEPDTVMP